MRSDRMPECPSDATTTTRGSRDEQKTNPSDLRGESVSPSVVNEDPLIAGTAWSDQDLKSRCLRF